MGFYPIATTSFTRSKLVSRLLFMTFFFLFRDSPPAAGCLGKPSLAHFVLLAGIGDRTVFPCWTVLPASRQPVRSAAHKRLVAIVKGLSDLWMSYATDRIWPSGFGPDTGQVLSELCVFA
jgi:hypothetical protein